MLNRPSASPGAGRPPVEPAAAVAYDDAPLGLFHLRVAAASTGGVFSDGFGLGIIGISLTLAAAPLALTPLWIGLLGGASLAGLFAGALLTGPIADQLGRRPIFAYNMLVLAGLSLLQYQVSSATGLLALRLAIGLVLGTDYVVSKALLTEFTPRAVRGRTLSCLSVAWAAGYACAYATGYALTALGPDAWRWMLLSSAAPCLAILPLRLTMPESPLWLVDHGRAAEAAGVVRARLGPQVLPPLPSPSARSTHGRWRQLASKAWRRRTVVGCVFFTCQVIPYFAVGTFVARVLEALELKNSVFGGLVYNVALLLGALIGLAVIDRMPRRRFLLGSFLIAAGALSILTAATQLNALLTILLFAVFAGVISGASNLVYVYLPELFPTDLRASGIGLAVAASRLGSAIGTFLLPVVVASFGVRSALGACVAVLLVGATVCQLWAPETKHLRLGALEDSALPGASGLPHS